MASGTVAVPSRATSDERSARFIPAALRRGTDWSQNEPGGTRALRGPLRRPPAPQIAGVHARRRPRLGLGIGANVALFSVVNSIFLRPLPYHEPERLVRLSSTERGAEPPRDRLLVSPLPRGAGAPAGVQRPGAVGRECVHVDRARRSGAADRAPRHGLPVIDLGARARPRTQLLGTKIAPAASPSCSSATRMWQERFNRDPAVLGQALTLDGAPYTIVGVLPEAATAFPLNQLQIWVPRPADVPYLVPAQLNNGGFFFQALARLRPGRVAGAGAGGDGRHRRRIPRGASGQRGCAVDDRARAAARRCRGGAAGELSDAVRRGRLRAADRLREHRQPAARALRRPPPGDRGTTGARRERAAASCASS
jgi:hypothetical protein